jgi:hypothetical protein
VDDHTAEVARITGTIQKAYNVINHQAKGG